MSDSDICQCKYLQKCICKRAWKTDSHTRCKALSVDWLNICLLVTTVYPKSVCQSSLAYATMRKYCFSFTETLGISRSSASAFFDMLFFFFWSCLEQSVQKQMPFCLYLLRVPSPPLTRLKSLSHPFPSGHEWSLLPRESLGWLAVLMLRFQCCCVPWTFRTQSFLILSCCVRSCHTGSERRAERRL